MIEGGIFGEGGFGINSLTGSIEASEGILVPLGGDRPPVPGSMGGAIPQYANCPSPEVDPTRHRERLCWFRSPEVDCEGTYPPEPWGVDEYVPIGEFFVEISDATPRVIAISAESPVENIIAWYFSPFRVCTWFAAQFSGVRPARAEMTIVIEGCVCDLDGDGASTSDDYFAFLQAFLFEGDADLNGDGVTDSNDFFEFIACWGGRLLNSQRGCPGSPEGRRTCSAHRMTNDARASRIDGQASTRQVTAQWSVLVNAPEVTLRSGRSP